MRKIFFLSFVFIFFPLISLAKNSLLITEVQIQGEKANEDFIKIYNFSKERINVSGFKLRKRSSSGKEYSIKVFPEGTFIESESFLIWANSKEDFSKRIKADIESTQTLAKNNSIALLNKEGEILDALCWGESNSPFVEKECFPENPSKNEILKRKKINREYQDTNNNKEDFYLEKNKSETLQKEPEVFSEIKIKEIENKKPVAVAGKDIFAQVNEEIVFDASASFDPDGDKISFLWNFGDGFTSKEKKTTHSFNFPGKYLVTLEVSDGKDFSSDSILVTIFPKGVIINEFIPNPQRKDEEKEWIEILNTNDFVVDISGWKIRNEKGKTFTFSKNSFLLPHQFLVLKRKTTKISLSNKGDCLSFFYPNDVLIEKIKYSEDKEGESIARNSKGEFLWTKIPTPGLPNIFSFEVERQIKNQLEKEVKEKKEKAKINLSSFSSSLSQIKEEKIEEIVKNYLENKKKTKNKSEQKKKEDFLKASFSLSFSPLKFLIFSLLASFFLGIIIIILRKRKYKI